MLFRWLNRLFHGPAWLNFICMGLSCGAFALCSVNLFEMFHANLDLIATYGSMAIWDGGVKQLLQLTFWGYLALGCYVVFKGCLDGLLHRIRTSARPQPQPQPQPPDPH